MKTINKQKLIEKGVIANERAIDIICGGYPCQPFSNTGQRLGEEDDRHLWPEMLMLIKELRPTWVLGEHVDGHVTLGLDTVLADLEEAGYTARAFVVPTAAVYAPHPKEKGLRCGQHQARKHQCGGRKERSASGSETLADTTSCGHQRQRQSIESSNQESSGERQTGQLINVCFGSEWTAQSRLGGKLDGLSDWLDGFRWPAPMGLEQFDWEPPRVIAGMKGKVREARLKSLGNAVNPVQVIPILWGIKQIHDQAI